MYKGILFISLILFFSFFIKLLKKYIERNKKFYTFYFLKLDISKYFYNIDHNVLKSLLISKLEKEEYELVCKIIDSTNYSYINNYIDKVKDKEIRKWHAKEALENDWSVSVLSYQILSKLYERTLNLN